MARMLNVNLKVHPSTFDLMMAALEVSTACARYYLPEKKYSEELNYG